MKTSHVLTIIILLSIIFNSCGTTHHFVPPRPLENKEYLISVNWHYNFDNSLKNLIFPELSYYTGIDNTNTVGGGFQFPIFISHLTYVNYNKINDNVYSNTFAHLNQFFGINRNPYVEVGVSYASKENYFWQMISTGIAIGDGDRFPLLFYLDDDLTRSEDGSKISLIPFLKYQLSGQNLGLSYIHYHGLTEATLKGIKKDIENSNETIIEISNKVISRIVESSQWGYPLDIYEIYLTNGDTLKLFSPYRHGDQMSYNPTDNTYLSRIGFIDYKVHIYKAVGDNEIGETTLRISDLITAFENGEDIILRRYALEILDEINNLNNFKIDHSVGVSIQTYKFRK